MGRRAERSTAGLEQDARGTGAAAVVARMMLALGVSTQTALADELGLGRGAVSDAKSKGKVPSQWVLTLLRTRRVTPSWLETGEGEMHLPSEGREELMAYGAETYDWVPMVEARASAGGGSLETGERILGYYAFRRDWLAGKGTIRTMRLMRVTGESMRPTLQDEDVVLVDLSQRDILAGKIYAVRMDDEMVVKRLEKKPGKLVLLSDNRALYEPLEISLAEYANVEVLGRVIWMAREMM
jgi:phage repressor protein C with HTH and peptisase S24 domain